jgi:hypothetical protein
MTTCISQIHSFVCTDWTMANIHLNPASHKLQYQFEKRYFLFCICHLFHDSTVAATNFPVHKAEQCKVNSKHSSGSQ